MWPGLTATVVEKYLPDSLPATDKFYMKWQRKGIRTTQDKLKEKLEMIETERDINPHEEREKINQIFSHIATVDKKDGTIYIENTANFLIRRIDGYIAILILYNWTTNAILATTIQGYKRWKNDWHF